MHAWLKPILRNLPMHLHSLPLQIMKSKPLKKGEDYYINEAGLYVFTAKYLRERGYCCGNGCKHCPYEKKQNQNT